MGDKALHEWVENFEEYEAVLRCVNPLGKWDVNATIRAFQTFGWDDATVPGSDLTFAHALSAVMIRYDGTVLAIDFGNDKLNDALPDLFAALVALGWSLAEVYHPAVSMTALLADLGAAIPANMTNFDVRPAKAAIEVSGFAESDSLVSRGRNALQMGSKKVGIDPVLTELESMTPVDDDSLIVSGSPNESGSLLGDVDDHEDDSVLEDDVAVLPVVKSVAPVAEQFAVSSLTPVQTVVVPPAPRLPEPVLQPLKPVVDVQKLVEDHSKLQASLLIENEHLRDALSIAQEHLAAEKDEVRRLLDDRSDRHEPWLLSELPEPEPVAEVVVNSDIFKDISMSPLDCVVNVGVSAICFDLPSAPMSDDDWERISEGYDFVLSIHPGAIGESLRWDVFGDVSTEFPWGSQLIARAMGFSDENCALVASILLELKESVVFAELRDVLAICASSGFDSKVKLDQFLAGVKSPGLKLLFSRLGAGELVKVLDEIVLRLGGLLLCPPGKAFVDLRLSSNDLAPEMRDAFSVLELATSHVPRLFVVHVDSLDGPFVTWVVNLLKSVATFYSSTSRYAPHQVDVSAESVVAVQKPVVSVDDAKTLAGIQASINQLSEKLRTLGI